MSDVFLWPNSELLCITQVQDAGQAVRLVLSAAAVERHGHAAVAAPGVQGFLKPLAWVFHQAKLEGVLADCVGAIAQGEWHSHPHLNRQVPLPCHCNERVHLTLYFRNGSSLVIEADSALCEPDGSVQFVESYAC